MALFTNHQDNNHLLVVASSMNQLCKGQDYTYVDEITDVNGEDYTVCIVFDGHGDNRVIEFIRGIPNKKMNKLVSTANPVESLSKYINGNLLYNKNLSSGSTMCLAKIYPNRIECINCGDSQIAVFKNGSLEYMNQEHNFKNEKERERLKDKASFTPSNNIKIVNPNTLVNVYSEYAVWDTEEDEVKLACTQSLGHNGITGFEPEVNVIPIIPGDNYKIIIGSDGLWDMIILEDEDELRDLYKKNIQDIMTQTTNRWLQEWNMQDLLNNDTNVFKGRFTTKQCDDIAIIVADIVPK
jgi:serine/threonine protein phosphatase PrpC